MSPIIVAAAIYIFVRRNARYPMLEVYDMPDTHETCARRDVTTTAPQALSYLNSDQAMNWAQSFAGRLIEEAGSDRAAQIDLAYRVRLLTLARRLGEALGADVPRSSRQDRCRTRGEGRETGLPRRDG